MTTPMRIVLILLAAFTFFLPLRSAHAEAARPAIDAMKQSLKTGKNKYVVRVSNRALSELLGTNNTVRCDFLIMNPPANS